MAVFKVGQRVRVVFSPDYPKAVGHEDVVGGIQDEQIGCRCCGSTTFYRLAYYGNGTSRACSCALEPIQPERNRLVAWEDVPGGRPKVEELA